MIDIKIAERLAEQIKIASGNIITALTLLEDGATIPFVARYRREQTGGLSDSDLLTISENYRSLVNFYDRQKTILREIQSQEKLTPELEQAILSAQTQAELEDLYRPYKPKRLTRGSKARAAGLDSLAQALLSGRTGIEDLIEEALGLRTAFDSCEKVMKGAADIIAEDISDRADIRAYIKKRMQLIGRIETEIVDRSKDPKEKYREFYQKNIAIKELKTYSFLAIKRAEKEGVIKVKYLFPEEEILAYIEFKSFAKDNPHRALLAETVADSYQRLIKPSVTNDIDSELFLKAEDESLVNFQKSLLEILLKPPYKSSVILGFDPGYHHGCKLAVIDATGRVLATDVIYPTIGKNSAENFLPRFGALLDRYQVEMIALGNGTASREAEDFIRLALATRPQIQYEIVSEDGASIYSVTKLAQEEFPQFDPNLRSAVSIARRLLDPLSELVKIDPSGLGVGQYQHDIDSKRLRAALEAVVVNAVNRVGVDINTASYSLLTYISGVSKTLADSIVKYIQKEGKILSRAEFKKIKGFGPKAFENAAGFLRVDGSEPFDKTSVHPESYDLARSIISRLGLTYPADKESLLTLPAEKIEELARDLGEDGSKVAAIIEDLAKPNRDPRGTAQKSIRDDSIRTLDDLKEGMILHGTVTNITDFGAFVDLGIHISGLIHISQVADRFVNKDTIRNYLRVGEVKKVQVVSIDRERQRIGLSMILRPNSVK